MIDSQLDAIIDGVKAAGADPNKVEWDDLKAAMKAIYQNQTSLEDLNVSTTSRAVFPKKVGENWTASTMSVPNGTKSPQSNGGWGLGHVITPALEFDSTPGTGILAAVFAPGPNATISGHNGLEFISNYRRMAALYVVEETGNPGAVVLHGYGTNRLQFDSESNIVMISATGRFEFEAKGDIPIYFFGYTAGSAFNQTICHINEDNALWAKTPLAVKSYQGKDAFQVWATANEAVIGGFTDKGHVFIPTTTYANDGAAATGGVKVGGLYWNGSVITQRRS